MRTPSKIAALTACLFIGTPPLPAPPQTAPRQSVAAIPALPDAAETGCGQIFSASGVRRWEKAIVVPGGRIADAAALAKLRGRPTIVYEARLAGQRLTDAPLSDICFEGGDLSRTDWRGISARGVALLGSNLTGARMADAVLQEAQFFAARLDGVDAPRADLTRARIEGGSFAGLRLDHARMRGFSVSCSLVSGDGQCSWPGDAGVDARGADLSHARFDLFNADDWRFDGARIDHTTVQLLQLKAFGAAAVKGPVILESSGDDGSAQVRLSPAEWRQLLRSNWMHGPSFACGRAGSPTERTICASDSLPRVDRELARVYRDGMAKRATTRRDQRRWLSRRDTCGAKAEANFERSSCIWNAYQDRLEELRKQLPIRSKFDPGEERLFITSDMVPPAAFARTALYARILPVLIATADTRLFIRAVGRGRIRAGAEAFGSNGHMCGLGGPLLDFSPASGSFGAPHSKDWLRRDPVPAREDVIRFVGEEAFIGPQDRAGWIVGEYAACGARAGFNAMAQVSIPASQRTAMARIGRALLASE